MEKEHRLSQDFWGGFEDSWGFGGYGKRGRSMFIICSNCQVIRSLSKRVDKQMNLSTHNFG